MIFSTLTRFFDLFQDDEHGYCVREVDCSPHGQLAQESGRIAYLSCSHALQRQEGLVVLGPVVLGGPEFGPPLDVVPAVVLMEMRRELSRRDHLSWLKRRPCEPHMLRLCGGKPA
jgi:hypothetical protein